MIIALVADGFINNKIKIGKFKEEIAGDGHFLFCNFDCNNSHYGSWYGHKS